MTTNTKHKHISKTTQGYVVSLPEDVSVRNGGTQRIQRKKLVQAVYARNVAFGYDPDQDRAPDFIPIALPAIDTSRVRFGLVGDTHLCNRQEALEELYFFYQELYQLDVRHVFHAGNWVDGDKIKQDVHTWGMHNQLDYFLKNYPQIDGMFTHILDGDDHEGWWHQDTGLYPGEVLVDRQARYGRDDLTYLGYMERDIIFTIGGVSATLKVVHGGGGSSKSISLASQNIIDAFAPDEIPDILALGHYHKAHFLPNYRGCFAIQTGSFVRQTAFMRKKKLASFVGGWVVDVSLSAENKLRVSATYLNYASQPWSYNPDPISLKLR